MTFATLIRGGHAVLDGCGVVECDLALEDGRIAGILSPGSRAVAAEEIDATGLMVIPGVIDAHVHFGMGSHDDWTTESRAAARGGVTTVLNYVMDARSYLEVEPEEREQAERSSVIDFAFHFILMNERHLSEVDAYVNDLGVSSFKYFTNFKGEEGAYLGVEGTDTGFFLALCRRIAAHPEAILAVHTENIEIVWRLAAELKAANRDGLAAWTESRPDYAEAHDMFTAFLLAERTGCRIYIPHLSSAAGLDVFHDFRARGGKATIETCPHYLTHTLESELDSLAKVNPPVRTARDIEVLWEAVADGSISVVGSDHNSRPRARKEGSIWTASAGFPGVTSLLPVMLSEGYHRRGIPLERIVEVLCSAPARTFGLHPTKGTIAPGTDADLTLVDLDRERVFDSAATGSHADYSIYDGRSLRGWPVLTLVRGQIVAREGEILAEPGSGRLLRRPVTRGASA